MMMMIAPAALAFGLPAAARQGRLRDEGERRCFCDAGCASFLHCWAPSGTRADGRPGCCNGTGSTTTTQCAEASSTAEISHLAPVAAWRRRGLGWQRSLWDLSIAPLRSPRNGGQDHVALSRQPAQPGRWETTRRAHTLESGDALDGAQRSQRRRTAAVIGSALPLGARPWRWCWAVLAAGCDSWCSDATASNPPAVEDPRHGIVRRAQTWART
jgi:hypothetical protein